MDPLSLNKLLTISDRLIEVSTEANGVTFSSLQRIVQSQSRAKDLQRRTRDIVRILAALGWLSSCDEGHYSLTHKFSEFVKAWNVGSLIDINLALAKYAPYDRFLDALQYEKAIRTPAPSDKSGKKALGAELYEKYVITFVAFDTFRYWALAVGQAHLSPANDTLYWGGDWNEDMPSLSEFVKVCRSAYEKALKTSGYAPIGQVADSACQELKISFQAFEMKLAEVLRQGSQSFSLAPATIRGELPRKFQIPTVRPRSEIIKDRTAARMRGVELPTHQQWLEYRYLIDGVRINERLLKLIRWETNDDSS